MRMSRLWHRLAPSAFFLWMGALSACGTEAMGTDACRRIEQARCRKAPACPALTVQAGTGVDECTQFARDRCLHGLAVADPGLATVDQCVTAIDRATSCDIIASPSSMPACAFLESSPAIPDAGTNAADATSEATPSNTAEASADGD
jgi:hypothetical protein